MNRINKALYLIDLFKISRIETQLNNYYLKQPEPIQSCLLALKDIILRHDKNITHQRKFQIPFFYYKDKKLCYLWVNKKKLLFGIVEDKNIYPKKDGIKRKDKMESIQIDPNADIPLDIILGLLKEKIKLYNKS
ncbi:MAG TPA: DUF1801 domain-containing protein [Bacteroidia bacterium]|nr:DUF1801 domain-containing protein [Bacteroidia bacterium]